MTNFFNSFQHPDPLYTLCIQHFQPSFPHPGWQRVGENPQKPSGPSTNPVETGVVFNMGYPVATGCIIHKKDLTSRTTGEFCRKKTKVFHLAVMQQGQGGSWGRFSAWSSKLLLFKHCPPLGSNTCPEVRKLLRWGGTLQFCLLIQLCGIDVCS